jgi:pimeloyl-ACP methyl ester carboxylesterase
VAVGVRRLQVMRGGGGFPDVQHRTVHGYARAFRIAGDGPALLLLHGIGDSSESWREVFGALSRDFTVIAPDLLGHGASAKPRADYSIGGFANGMRDLLSVLDVERATIVGHSLGGGVAMQFAYQYPERCERLVLVGAGGVSRSVNPLLRAASLPGAALAIGTLRVPAVHRQVRTMVGVLERLGTSAGLDGPDLLRVVDALPDHDARRAFIRTLRAVVDHRGQVVTMLDRSYLAAGMPTLVVWGTRDAVVPVHHARIAHAAMPGSRLELFRGAGHFPHRSDPERFVSLLRDFVATTEPSEWSPERWSRLLRHGREDPSVVEATAGA